MNADPENVIEPGVRPERADDSDEALDDAAQGVNATSDDLGDGTKETGEAETETGEIDAMGRAAGLVERADRPLRGIDEVERRDVHRWELDPASAERDPATEGDPVAK